MIIYDSEQKYFYSTLINNGRFFSGFTTKFFGDARQTSTIFNAFRTLQISYSKIVIPEQIHSVNIAVYSVNSPNVVDKIPETDGVITHHMNTALTVITGDCVPIIYCDPVKELIAISHQGWRGALKKMSSRMVRKMIDLGSSPDDIRVSIGPSIGACCYEVDDDLFYTFKSDLDGYSEKVFHAHHGRYHLNMNYLNYLYSIDAGLRKDHIDFFPFCTKCDKGRFFSFRRDKKQEYGEMLGFIIMKP